MVEAEYHIALNAHSISLFQPINVLLQMLLLFGSFACGKNVVRSPRPRSRQKKRENYREKPKTYETRNTITITENQRLKQRKKGEATSIARRKKWQNEMNSNCFGSKNLFRMLFFPVVVITFELVLFQLSFIAVGCRLFLLFPLLSVPNVITENNALVRIRFFFVSEHFRLTDRPYLFARSRIQLGEKHSKIRYMYVLFVVPTSDNNSGGHKGECQRLFSIQNERTRTDKDDDRQTNL